MVKYSGGSDRGTATLIDRADQQLRLELTNCDSGPIDPDDAKPVDVEAPIEDRSPGGLGVLFATQKRLVDGGHGLRLVNLNPHIPELFHIAGFDTVFEIA